MREHGAECRLADTAFTAENEYLVLYRGEARGYERNVGVGAFRCGGAYCLVGAAGAVICETGLLRFGARTVFYVLSSQLLRLYVHNPEVVRGRMGGGAYLAPAQPASGQP